MSDIIIYLKKPAEGDRWFKGDIKIRKWLRKVIRGNRIGGIERVFINLCKGFDLLNIRYKTNIPFDEIKPEDKVIVLGIGKNCLDGYKAPNKIIAGIGLMTHPAEWPSLLTDYPVAKYLQHSDWTRNIYKRYYGEKVCEIWPSGIDTEYWNRRNCESGNTYILYNKLSNHNANYDDSIVNPIRDYLKLRGIRYQEFLYGTYKEKEYHEALEKSEGMIYLSTHESQGIAYCQAMSMNVPILAWNLGRWLDPNRRQWGEDDVVEASSVPFFDTRCGVKFNNISEFDASFTEFEKGIQNVFFSPREYVLEKLTLEKSASRMLEIIKEVYR